MPASRLRFGVTTLVLGTAALVGGSGVARADILVFKTGRTMSVAASRTEGDQLRVTLRDGGEASLPMSVIERIDPDEVPYPAAAVAEAVAPQDPPRDLAEETRLAGRPFADLIAAAATTHGVDVRLVHAVIAAESNYEPRARSRKGAKGLMQLMPETARQYAVRDPYDPRANIDAGVKHLKGLLSRFELRVALAAYNAGEATIRKYGGIPPFAETRGYVSGILARLGR